ncbi:uncharacterized protein LOC120371300 isoform X2 [Mauremys reevesii]|uniref:uncharacterized protein LOC120371300 isoform X2 n=1 Tax=Mauremys reevesii TaxID=260615 RepID=UPI00193EFD23|nr:uncharacterized protein LOC120371300 isoform X2 [Mauremys reevesii]
MEETLKWLVTTVQEMQQSQWTEQQTLMTWQADQQMALQEFIKEQSATQQQLLQEKVDKKEQIHMVPAGGALRTQKRESLSSQFLYPVSQRPGSLKEKL